MKVRFMDNVDLKSLRNQLEQARAELTRRAARNADEGREPRPEDGSDAADQAVATYTKELTFTQSENESELLQMVNGALQRMDEGIYGQCLSCAKEIAPKRLNAVPWTHFCIDCQEKAEQMDQSRDAA
jgi:DnaK suppressor protein